MDNLVVSTNKKITMDKILSQVKVIASSGIKKILDTSVNSVVQNADCSNNVVSVGGKVLVKVVYLSNENAIESADTIYEFADKQKAEFSLTDCFAKDSVMIEGVSFSDNEIICMVSHIVEVFGVYKYEMPIILSAENDLVLSRKMFTSLKMVTSAEDTFVVAEEVDSNIQNVEILRSTASVVLSEVSCAVDKIILEGKVVSDVFYKTDESVGVFAHEFDFKQEISAENVVPNMISDAIVILKNITVTPEQSENKTTLVYAVDLVAKGYVFEETTYEVASDMFSLKNEIQTTYDYFETRNFVAQKTGEDTYLSQTDVSLVPNFDDVLTVTNASAKVLNIQKDNEKWVANVFVSAVSVCRVAESYESVYINGECIVDIDGEDLQNLRSVDVSAQIASFKVKAGKDLEVNFKLNYVAKFENEVSQKFIKSFEIKGEKESDFYGIKVYISKQGQTIFDVAKVLNVKPEIISAQNQVEDVFEQGQKIYVYSPVNLA